MLSWLVLGFILNVLCTRNRLRALPETLRAITTAEPLSLWFTATGSLRSGESEKDFRQIFARRSSRFALALPRAITAARRRQSGLVGRGLHAAFGRKETRRRARCAATLDQR